MTRVLVYGTLRRGQRAHAALAGAKFVEELRIPGFDMFRLYGFPGVKENPDNKDGIVGEVFEVDDANLKYIDYYEGFFPNGPVDRNHYIRKEIEVRGEPTQIYVYNKDTEGPHFPRVVSGNWVKENEL